MVARHVVTLSNSIVGVSVLAMPFCFKQCGIVLATLSLMTGAVMTRMVCYFLLKAAVMNRRRTYEMLAWSTFGHTGKFMVEISIIGFLIGTLIAFMVVIGDLGPEILSEIFSVENNSSLRTIIMTALSLFVALPLGLLKNIDSLSSVSTASVLFYLFLVIKIFSEGFSPLWSGEYLERIHFWRSGGVLQCIPIFSMALSCQTQIFGIYDALPEPSLQAMNEIVKRAVHVCTFFYFCVGFFGYIAFSHQNFGGNILLSFTPTWSTQLIKSMFLMSVVFSVPLVVFPCRVSLHSLIFKSSAAYHHVHDISTNYIPESRMKFLTVTIVGFTLIIGILIPNIELVLGLVGSTTGSVICIIFPSIMFVRVTSKNTTERLLAQVMFFVGVTLMFLTTYATLYAAEQSQIQKIENIADQPRATEDVFLPKPELIMRQDPAASKLDTGSHRINRVEFEPKIPEKMISVDNFRTPGLKKESSSPAGVDIKKEPVAVQEEPRKLPSSPKIVSHGDGVIGQHKLKEPESKLVKEDLKKTENDDVKERKEDVGPNTNDKQQRRPEPLPEVNKDRVDTKDVKDSKPARPEDSPVKPKIEENQDPNKPSGVGSADTKKEFVDKNVAEEFLKRLEEHQESQKKILEEQKEILEELKQHHAHDIQEKLEKDKKKEQDSEKPMDGQIEERPNAVANDEPKSPSQQPGNTASDVVQDKIIQQQEKIIKTMSDNIEKENKNVQLLEKFEEGLNQEVKLMDSQQQINVNKTQPQVNLDTSLFKNDQQQAAAPLADPEQQKGDTNNALNWVDKDKGVLVGSLSVKKADADIQPESKLLDSKVSEAKLQPSNTNSIKTDNEVHVRHDKKPAKEQKPKPSADQQQVENLQPNKNLNVPAPAQEPAKAEDVINSNVKQSPNPIPPSPSEPSEKVSNKVPKEKIDREI